MTARRSARSSPISTKPISVTVLQALDPEERDRLVRLMGNDFDWVALTEVDDTVRSEMLESIPNEQIAEAVRELDSDDAVEIIADLDREDREEVLAGLPYAERIALERRLDYPEESAGRRMTTQFIAVPPFWTVGQTIDFMREEPRLPDEFTELYVVNPSFHFLGNGAARQAASLQAPDQDRGDHQRGEAFGRGDRRPGGRGAPVRALQSCSPSAWSTTPSRLVGVITVDDIVDIIEEEADEDIKRLAGVGDEEISEGVFKVVRLRSSWLLVNLVTAFLSASVISLFQGTIERIAILAMLFPIVAGLGGNAGTQTLTVTVRALATQQLNPGNTWRLIGREALVGVCNGVVLGCITGLLVALIFQHAGARPRHCRRHAHKPERRGARRHHHPARPRPARHRSGRRLEHLRHGDDRRDRVLRLSLAGDLAADVRATPTPNRFAALRFCPASDFRVRCLRHLVVNRLP